MDRFRPLVGAFFLFSAFVSVPSAWAQDLPSPNAAPPAASQQAPGEAGKEKGGLPTSEASFKGVCQDASVSGTPYAKFPKCAKSPNECFSNPEGYHPLNCLFLTEPIGGQPNYDLYKKTCGTKLAPTEAQTGGSSEGPAPAGGSGGAEDAEKEICIYELWGGEFLVRPLQEGPFQALLSYEEGKEYQGPFTLLYSYLGVVYNYLSGLILALVIFVTIFGGVEMITSNGNSEQFGKGKDRIVKALIGMAVWFLASVILYTINPTFFTF